ncbi:rhomboid family intramembrane serine protease [Candidatus Pacearchaeota archaeon]|nr:rhomboid family intramembrane serine protease [Candidatus Pacearchaeota archaeon]
MIKFRYYSIILAFICIIVFFLQLIIPGFTDLFILNLSALYGFQIWRFLTAIFLHGSLLHLMYNMFALLLFGFILEKKIGSRNFLIVFLSSGILANLIAVNYYPSSLGASGAVYGILGCLTILNPFIGVWVFGIIVPMFIAAIIWIIGGIFGLFFPSNVGDIAHLSGIFIGFLFGFLFFTYRNKRERKDKILLPNDYIKNWEERYLR